MMKKLGFEERVYIESQVDRIKKAVPILNDDDVAMIHFVLEEVYEYGNKQSSHSPEGGIPAKLTPAAK